MSGCDSWIPLNDFIAVLNRITRNGWCWSKNARCKYVELRIDMRDGHCFISDRDGNDITLEELAYQHGEANEK
jgi:hypothetical protein